MTNLLFSEALAQTAATTSATPAGNTTAQQPSPLASLAPFALVFVVFYFLLIRPQKKKMQEEQSMIDALGKGDEVFTKSGLIGTISGMTEKVVTLEVSDGVKIKVLRSHIGGLYSKLFEKTNSASSAVTTDKKQK